MWRLCARSRPSLAVREQSKQAEAGSNPCLLRPRFRPLMMPLLAGFALLACACAREEGPAEILGARDRQVFGGATQELEDRGSYVYCCVTGPGTVSGGVQGMKQVFRYARANQRRRILLDIENTELAELTIPQIIGGTLSLLPSWDFGTRISVLMRDETLPTLVDRNSFPLGRIRLIKLRRFAKMEDAEAWLLADD